MKKKIIIPAALILVLAAIFLFATMDKGEEKKTAEKEDRIQIGMVFDSFVIERWLRERDVFVSTAKELGAEVNVQNSNGDAEEQKKQIEYFIKKGMDAIVIICTDSYGLSDTVKKAKNAGIKVIAYDRLITDANVDLYISFDNEMVGTMMGEALVEQNLKKKKVLMLGGSPVDNNVPLVEDAFRKVMEKNGITIVDSIHADGWKAEIAAQYVYDNMDVVEQVDAIMCGNDNLAGSVIQALSVNRLAGDILVVGQDGELEACQKIVEGTQLMTVYKPVEKLARCAAEYTVRLVKEGSITPEGEDTVNIDDGSYMVPYVGIEPISVSKENIDEVIIDSGFHLHEDVYLNVPGENLSDEKISDEGGDVQ